MGASTDAELPSACRAGVEGDAAKEKQDEKLLSTRTRPHTDSVKPKHAKWCAETPQCAKSNTEKLLDLGPSAAREVLGIAVRGETSRALEMEAKPMGLSANSWPADFERPASDLRGGVARDDKPRTK